MAEPLPQTAKGMVERSDEFLDIAEVPANVGVFNLDDPQLQAWRGQVTVVETLLSEEETLQTRLDGVRAQLKVETPKLEKTARAGFATAAASPASDELKAEAGVTIRKPRVDSAPITPTKLVAMPHANGSVELEWERTGNIRGAKFIIEKRVGTGDWVLVDIITATSGTSPAKVGERASFRVKARNGQGISMPSNEAVIYDS